MLAILKCRYHMTILAVAKAKIQSAKDVVAMDTCKRMFRP